MYTEETLKRYEATERKLEAYRLENNWWYNFYEAAGAKFYDAEEADKLRRMGISPEETADLITY